jgi:hypothetical protein
MLQLHKNYVISFINVFIEKQNVLMVKELRASPQLASGPQALRAGGQHSLRGVVSTSRRPAFHSDGINRLPLTNLYFQEVVAFPRH